MLLQFPEFELSEFFFIFLYIFFLSFFSLLWVVFKEMAWHLRDGSLGQIDSLILCLSSCDEVYVCLIGETVAMSLQFCLCYINS